MAKAKKATATKAKATTDMRIMPETVRATRQSIKALQSLGEHEKAKAIAKAYGKHVKQVLIQANAERELEREKAVQAAIAELPFDVQNAAISDAVNVLRGALVSMPNREGTRAHKLNQALLARIDKGEPVTLPSICELANVTPNSAKGHLTGKASSALNGVLAEQGLRFRIGDTGASLVDFEGNITKL
jgi:hypothetical protein